MSEYVRLHPDDIKAIREGIGTKYESPEFPRGIGRIGRGGILGCLSGQQAVTANTFGISPLVCQQVNYKKTLQLLGYRAAIDLTMAQSLFWLVEVSEQITGTTQAVGPGNYCLTPDQIKAAYPTMAEMRDKYVRTLGMFDNIDHGVWTPFEGASGLLEKGHGLALCWGAANNTTACYHGIVELREYNAR